MTKAVSYLRVSSLGQCDGDGFMRQAVAIQSYAIANQIEIVEEFRDEGISGKTELEGRAGLAACLARVENNGVKLVLVESADRLARDAMIAEIIIRQFQKAGVKVISASGGVDLTAGDDTNPTAKLIRQILAAVAEFDRCVIVLKLRAARDRKRAKGQRVEGQPPYGYRNEDCDGVTTLVPVPEEQVIVKLITDLNNWPAGDVADYLNGSLLKTRCGGKWHATQVRRIMERETTTASQRA
jgi:DNA invertase Pin-like site-specific DNA recombinase